MPLFNAALFMEEAVESVLAQTYANWELLLINDGSTDGSTEIAERYTEQYPERIRYLEHPNRANRGASASRNVGIKHARGEYIALLDADDVWLPNKLEEQVPLLEVHPDVGSLYGNTLYWYSWTGHPADLEKDFLPRLGFPPNTVLLPPRLLVENLKGRAAVPCTCSLLMRRSVVEEVGGFDEGFHSVFTDQSFYAKLFLAAPVLVSDQCWDKYRRHDDSSCSVMEREGQLHTRRLVYLNWVSNLLTERGLTHGELWQALQEALQPYRHPRVYQMRRRVRRVRRRAGSLLERAARRWLSPQRYASFKKWARSSYPKVGFVRFGSLRRTSPISRVWGRERGRSLDRYYIENFLEAHRADVRGRVLEVGDATYTRQYGGDRVTHSDVLHVEEGNPEATIVADLASADHIPSDTFDCIILTETLQLVYDVPAALRTLRRILKPGGVLLTTFPGITHTGDADWQSTWYWSFTTNSARRLFGEAFGAEHSEIRSCGNVLAATAFLYGLADRELKREELDHHDPAYDVVITVRAVKPENVP
jgi:glycosyltransferase involved in cell wall biosynthesis